MREGARVSRTLIASAAGIIGVLALLFATGRLDSNAPTLAWDGVDQGSPFGGTVELSFRALDDRPGLRDVTVILDEGTPQSVDLDSTPGGDDDSAPRAVDLALASLPVYHYVLDTTTLEDGPHTAVMRARDASLLGNRAEIHLTFVVDNTLPTLLVARESLRVRQGDTACLVARADEALASLQGQLDDRAFPFYPVGDKGYRALVGIGVKREAGAAPLTLVAVDRAGNETRRGVELQVAEVDFPAGGYIALSTKQEKDQKDKDKGKQANQKRGAAYATEAPEQSWQAAFQRPAAGPVTSPFGKFRTYSTGVKRHHLGVDIANATGTPVVAPADGLVTLAEELHIYGNAVILAHGQGISSSYNHLATLAVQVGQRVWRGDRLGTMGSTGQSTGPHLHWGMVAGGVAVDPEQFTRETFDVSGYQEFF